MTTKRIRCSCGRVYDPVKRAACPDCGTVNVVAPAPPSLPLPETPKVSRRTAATITPAPSLTPSRAPINPRFLVIGAAILVLFVIGIVLSRRGQEKKIAAVVPTPTVAQASATPAAAVSTPGPSPAPTAAHREPTIAPTLRPAVEITPAPTAPSPAPALEPNEYDLAAAVARAAPGAQLKIPPGSYGNLVLTRPIQLVGDPNRQVFIKGEGKEALVVKSTGVSVQNIQFVGHGIGPLPAVSVTAGAALEMDACIIQSTTTIGLFATGKASVKAVGTTFAVPEGAGLRLTEQAKANLTQCSISDTKIGLNAWSGGTAELHSCAFERDGGSNGGGTIFALNGEGTVLTADACHFLNNVAGLLVANRASATITKSQFRENAAGAEGGVLGLVSVRDGGQIRLTNDGFESNRQGVAVNDGGTVEITQCNFVGNGLEQRQVVPASLPLLVSGNQARARVRKTTFTDSAQYAIGVMAGGDLTLEEVDISGSRIAAVILGERNSAPVRATIRRSHLNGNGTGLGLLAGSSAELEDCEFRENNDGLIVFDAGTVLKAQQTAIVGNRERGLYVYSGAEASLLDCDLKNNARGAVSGTRGRASERASITLENCRFGGNRVFGAGASAQSKLTLTNCVFDGSDKTNISKERGAIVETNEPPTPVSSPTPPAGMEPSPGPEENVSPSVSPSAKTSVSPSPGGGKGTPRPRRKPTPRPHPPTPEDIRRALRKFLPGGN